VKLNTPSIRVEHIQDKATDNDYPDGLIIMVPRSDQHVRNLSGPSGNNVPRSKESRHANKCSLKMHSSHNNNNLGGG
jgi:hypothetical protein